MAQPQPARRQRIQLPCKVRIGRFGVYQRIFWGLRRNCAASGSKEKRIYSLLGE